MGHETRRQDESCLPQPLTRRNAAGQVYQRLAVVDRQIKEALGLDDEELRSHLEVRDEKSPAFLKEESLVYLIRHHHGAENRNFVNDLAECLLKRCATWIDGKLRGLRTDLMEDGNSGVVAELFERILNLASDRGDFLQVRFWMGIERITVNVFRKQVTQFDTESSGDYDQITIDDLTQRGAVVVPTASAGRPVESEAVDNVLIEAALHQLESQSGPHTCSATTKTGQSKTRIQPYRRLADTSEKRHERSETGCLKLMRFWRHGEENRDEQTNGPGNAGGHTRRLRDVRCRPE